MSDDFWKTCKCTKLGYETVNKAGANFVDEFKDHERKKGIC